MNLTEKQRAALREMAGPATHQMLFGGSRSGKTFLVIRNIVVRAIKAPGSRHAVLRFRFNHLKASIIYDTFPKVMRLAFPGIEYKLDKSDWFAKLPNDSEIWFGGLDDKERTEKILGQEYVTIFLNEVSQIPYSSRNMALTRLAQKVDQQIDGKPAKPLKPRMFYDCNPPSKAHWSYLLFVRHLDPDTRQPIPNPEDYLALQMNPQDNAENLSDEYLRTLETMPARMRKRFLLGEFADANPNALFREEDIEKWRLLDGNTPDMVRVVVAVDPSGASDVDAAEHDAVGIVVAGLGTDGNAYVLEDATVQAGPATWGNVAVTAYDRHKADRIVGEINYGGAMVEHTIRTVRHRIPYRGVHASRGKAVRAEPISALYEQGKVRHVGYFHELEDELANFSTAGYIGDESPNRADALIWALTELFEGIVQGPRKKADTSNIITPQDMGYIDEAGWML